MVPGNPTQASSDVLEPSEAEHRDHQVSQCCKNLRCTAGTHLAAVLIKSSVPYEVAAVFDAPMSSDVGSEVLGTRLFRGCWRHDCLVT